MPTRGYGTYRGRSPFRTFLIVLIVILLVLLVLLTAAVVFLEPHVVYSVDGIQIDFPFLQDRDPEGNDPTIPDALPTQTLIVPSPTPTPTPEPTPEPVPPFHGVMLPAEALYDGTAQQQLDSAGGNAAVFDMKTDEGTLHYISQLALAEKASASDGAINAAIQLLNTGDLYTVARISCFRDNTVPRANMDLSIRSSAGNWRDDGNIRWLSVNNPNARAYVIGVCVELAQLGFDELLLDNCCFPNRGKTNTIRSGLNYDSDTLEADLALFFAELSDALLEYPDVKVSVMTTETVLNGAEGDVSGQSLELLADYAWRLWVIPGETADFTAALTQLAWDPKRIVPSAGEVRPLDTSWVVFSGI